MLAPPLRNFATAKPDVICKAALGRFASGLDEAEKTGKTAPSFRQAKRSVSQGMP